MVRLHFRRSEEVAQRTKLFVGPERLHKALPINIDCGSHRQDAHGQFARSLVLETSVDYRTYVDLQFKQVHLG